MLNEYVDLINFIGLYTHRFNSFSFLAPLTKLLGFLQGY